MWIRLKDNIPPIEGGTPPVNAIFWAVQWINIDQIKRGFAEFLISKDAKFDFDVGREWHSKVALRVSDIVWANPAYLDQWYEDKNKELNATIKIHKANKMTRKDVEAYDQLQELERLKEYLDEYFKGEPYPDRIRGAMCPNKSGLYRIRYNNRDIGIWKHEFEEVKADEIMEAVEDGDYVLMPDSVADGTLLTVTDESLQPIIDSAMLDGCTKEQAKLVAIGVDITEEYALPPVGWYKFITPEEVYV